MSLFEDFVWIEEDSTAPNTNAECFSCGQCESCEIIKRIDENPQVAERGRSLTYQEIYGSFGDTIIQTKRSKLFDPTTRARLDQEIIDVDALIESDTN